MKMRLKKRAPALVEWSHESGASLRMIHEPRSLKMILGLDLERKMEGGALLSFFSSLLQNEKEKGEKRMRVLMRGLE
jgi:hypothetical protein